MTTTLDTIIARLLSLEVRLLACRERLRADTDPEALHDLRTAVRRLRSLLRPLRRWPGIERLEAAAKAVGQMTTPWRDCEVLAAHLFKAGLTEPAQRRERQMAGVYAKVAVSAELEGLLRLLAAVPMFLRTAERDGQLKRTSHHLQKRLDKQWHNLIAALKDPAHDRHRLRLLIKRVRYAGEAYPELDRSPKRVARALKHAQEALGDWHDNFQWLHQAERQPDLAPCIATWQAGLVHNEAKSDVALDRLLRASQR